MTNTENALLVLCHLRTTKPFCATILSQVNQASIWNSHHQTEIDRIEKVQRTVARWACKRWRDQS